MGKGIALLAALAALAATGPPPVQGQTEQVPSAPCEQKRPMTAVTQALGVNVAINRVDAWVFGWDWAKVGFQSWSKNLGRGWKWDANQVAVNMFAHPYHGSLYFAAARANCLSFWEAIPIVYLGSWTWEYLGETWHPSLNDFYTTGLGGPVLGEILHRLSIAVLDEEARGGERIVRETAALLINPVGGLNRLVRGQWTRYGPNPSDRLPASYRFNAKVGGRQVEASPWPDGVKRSPTFLLEVSFGSVFDTPYGAPFDVVDLTAQVSPDGGGLNLLQVTGRLWGTELTPRESWHRHQLFVNQRFDYLNNPVYHFGEQSLEVGVHSLLRIGPGGLRVTTKVAGDLVMISAMQPLDPGPPREIDWGPGVGAIGEVAISANGTTYLSFFNRVRHLRSVSGVPADHTILFSGLDVTIPITRGLGIGAYLSGDRRTSDYHESFPDAERSYSETRVYLTWTFAGSTPGR